MTPRCGPPSRSSPAHEVLELLLSGQDLVLGRFQDSVQTAQDRERQDHVAVLVRLVGPTQQLGDLPDQVGIGLRHVRDSLPGSYVRHVEVTPNGLKPSVISKKTDQFLSR